MRILAIVCALALLAASFPRPARAAGEINFCVDIPTTVSAATYQPFQTVNGYAPAAIWSYSVNAAGPGSGLGPGVHIDALNQIFTGLFYFSVDAPATISAISCHPADILSYGSGVYGKDFDHAADLSLPESADITALAYGNGVLYFALDAPLTLNKTGGGTLAYDPRQLIHADVIAPATYSVGFDGVAAGIPPGTRITGAESLGAAWLLNFDVPVTLSGTLYMPGDIVQYSGAAWSLYYRDTAVFPSPPPNAMTDFSLPLPPGEANNLKLAKSGANLALTWGNAACAYPVVTRDYSVYEGALGTWYSHNTAKACTTGGVTNATVTPGGGNQYYLVVPSNGAFEGNYGADSSGTPIPASAAACRASQATSICP